MQRLLTDAEKLTGVKYDMSNLGDVYAAIHAIQGDLGLTGGAAAEASETFSGSFEAMKASAANLLGALALGEDVTPMMSTFIKSIGTFVFGNLLPMIGTVVKSLPAALSSAISTGLPILQKEGPKLLNTIVQGIQTNLPKLIAMGLKLLTSIQQGITSNLPTLMTTAANIITSVGAWITANLPIIIDKGKLLLFNMIDGIMGALPQLATAASNIITSIANFLAANLPTIGEKGGQMLQVLATKIISSIPQVIAAAAKIAVAISKALIKIAPIALKAAVSMIKSLVSGIKNGAASCLSAAKGLVDAKIMPPLKGLVAKVKTVFNNVKNAMVNTWNTIKSRATTLWNSIKTAITSPIESAKNTISGVISTIKGFFPISIGKIMSNIQLPHFSVSGGQAPWGFGGQGSLPSVKLTWNAKAMQNPYLFSDATLFGAGEAGDEVLYGRANLMRDIQEERQLTYIFVTHDLSVVKYISDRIGVMYLGNMVELADSQEIFDNPVHPYTEALLNAIPTTVDEFHRELQVLEGDIPSPVNPPKGCKFHTRCAYCTEICKQVVPAWEEVSPNHFVACHHKLHRVSEKEQKG